MIARLLLGIALAAAVAVPAEALDAQAGGATLSVTVDQSGTPTLMYTFSWVPPLAEADIECPGLPSIPVIGYLSAPRMPNPMTASYDYLTSDQAAALAAGNCELAVLAKKETPRATAPLK